MRPCGFAPPFFENDLLWKICYAHDTHVPDPTGSGPGRWARTLPGQEECNESVRLKRVRVVESVTYSIDSFAESDTAKLQRLMREFSEGP